MSSYYFLTASLPALKMGEAPELTLYEFETLLRENLTSADMESVAVLRRYYDLNNIRALWREEALDVLGNLDESALEEALLTRDGLPEYVYEFLDTYDDTSTRLRYFPSLIQRFFQAEADRAEGFLHDYLVFEREWRLVFVGFRAKRLGRDLAQELQFEDSGDDLVAQMLAQRDVAHYEPPYRYEELKPVFERFQDDPLALHQALCEYRFGKVEELVQGELFSMDIVLAYMAQLILVERWQELDEQRGQSVVQSMLQ